MKKKFIPLVLSIVLSLTLTSCTQVYETQNTQPTTNTPGSSSKTPPETTRDIPKEQTKSESPAVEVPKEEIKPDTPAPEPPKEPTVFKLGDKGDTVKEIQQKLNKFGYKLSVDGSFGAATKSAVLDFQKRNKINPDGMVGAETLAKLDKKPTVETLYKPPATTPKTYDTAAIEQYINSRNFPSKTKYFIWIDIPKQRVNVFTGSNNNWKLLKSMICSTGKSRTPTIKGNFTVGIKGSYFIADSGARCKWYTQIKGNYLFHSVLYDNKGNKIIDGTLSVPASHGCVRLATENAKFIYDNIPAGTAIWSN
jgi:peptidoglycan hydrolase-like protein with peptidoglycan-binding domain